MAAVLDHISTAGGRSSLAISRLVGSAWAGTEAVDESRCWEMTLEQVKLAANLTLRITASSIYLPTGLLLMLNNVREKHAICASSCSSQCPNSICLNRWRTNTHTQSQEQRWSKCVYSICLTGLPMACPEAKIIAYHHIDVILLIIQLQYFYLYLGHPRSWKYPEQWTLCTKTQYHPSCLGLGQTFGYFRIRFLHWSNFGQLPKTMAKLSFSIFQPQNAPKSPSVDFPGHPALSKRRQQVPGWVHCWRSRYSMASWCNTWTWKKGWIHHQNMGSLVYWITIIY